MTWQRSIVKKMTDIKNRLNQFGNAQVESLAKYTTWKIGGSALCFTPKSIESLVESVTVLNDLSWNILGGGSNILFADNHLRSIILRLNSFEFKAIKQVNNDQIYCGSGVTVSELLRFTREKELSCLEFLAGLPATIGGLVQMNASFKGKSISDYLTKVVLVDEQYKELKQIDSADLDFSYRHSGLKGKIIVGAFFKALPLDVSELEVAISDTLNYRAMSQEWGACTAGCVFKNPEGFSAGKLIDECGLKGKSHGDAIISRKHANFIVNNKHAKASDIVYLIEKIKETVYKKKNIILEEEIIRIEC